MTLVTGALALALVLAEVATRVLDGYPLTALRLLPFAPSALRQEQRELADIATALGVPPDVDARWIEDSPPREAHAVDPDLLALRARLQHPDVPEYNLYYVWNSRFVDEMACKGDGDVAQLLRHLPAPLEVFDPTEPSIHPPFRHLAGRTTPLGLTTNQLGYRGPDVPLDKPPRTIRIAFVGASTTLGHSIYPVSYPELVVYWLNRWAERAGLDVRFDGVNAGRAGINSSDIAAVVRQEVAPLEPDLVLYYEGANQFVFFAPLTDAGADARRWAKGLPPATWTRWVAWPRQVSALARRLDDAATIVAARGGREPAKPDYTLRWPAGLDEQAPDITRSDLPLSLPVILGDLDSIRHAVGDIGGELALASFVWLAGDGLELDPIRQRSIYTFLNERCWPYRYADIRRLADLQNRVFARYAAAHGLIFVDVAGIYPSDPSLFFDAIHFNGPGTRLQAWIVFRELLPYVRERLASGAWPRADRTPLTRHPAIGTPRAYHPRCAP